MRPAPSYELRWRAIFPEGQMLFEILYAGQMRILLPLFIELLISILSLITIYCGSIWLNAMFTSLHLKLFRPGITYCVLQKSAVLKYLYTLTCRSRDLNQRVGVHG